jgi:hypothetical protein
MSLRLKQLTASLIPALPFQHISKLSCAVLIMQATADSSAAGETQKLKGVLELLQSKGTVLQVGAVMGSESQYGVASGLSALTGPGGCHIVFSKPSWGWFSNMLLDVADITAIARTLGSQLVTLQLYCQLTPAALGAITASGFPRLRYLRGLCFGASECLPVSTGLVALCMDWPRDRMLEVSVRQSSLLTNPILDACQAALQARGICNVSVVRDH